LIPIRRKEPFALIVAVFQIGTQAIQLDFAGPVVADADDLRAETQGRTDLVEKHLALDRQLHLLLLRWHFGQLEFVSLLSQQLLEHLFAVVPITIRLFVRFADLQVSRQGIPGFILFKVHQVQCRQSIEFKKAVFNFISGVVLIKCITKFAMDDRDGDGDYTRRGNDYKQGSLIRLP